jgi:hypothetical protein
MVGRLRANGDGQHQESDSGNRRAIEFERKHHGSPWLQDLRQSFDFNVRKGARQTPGANVRIGPLVINLECKPSRRIKPCDNAAFGR